MLKEHPIKPPRLLQRSCRWFFFSCGSTGQPVGGTDLRVYPPAARDTETDSMERRQGGKASARKQGEEVRQGR
jgi:hypothetical protein